LVIASENELRRLNHVELLLRFERAAADCPEAAIEAFRAEFERFEARIRAFAAVHAPVASDA